MTDLVDWLSAQLDEDERLALKASPAPWKANDEHDEVLAVDDERVADGFALSGNQLRATVDHIVTWDPSRALAFIDRDRRILTEHRPVLSIVEWPHDQTGEGKAWVCPRCQNADHTEWNPPVGHAGVLPDGFVTGYVLAPCRTLLLLTLGYGDRPGFDPQWALAAVA